ncbi:MAG: thiamine phosphate synthase [Kaiparowitsia implicata GSE-PSE-MK54-09C]|jgi:thiamine-phosphate pyrophosphorylase|nr:thiamine phosphate synthase [Kaiparowitsia implicata GSE-PSE-MK54-09C]
MDGERTPAAVAVNRILDANLDRAREGVRIVEEWCRFGLNNAELAAECKDLRQAIAHWHSADIRAARDTPGDVGTALSHANETQRTSVSDILQVNLSRIQEALRVLEEYGKLVHPDLATDCKQLRYRVYGLESKLLAAAANPRQEKLRRSPLYLVTTPSDTLLTTVEAALQGGLTLVQYRDKHTPDGARLSLAQALRHLCERYNALFIVNDRIDLALAVQADGVHLGQEDAPIAVARHLLGPQALIGRSTHCPDELQRAIAEGADYVGIGPVYATPTKAGRAAVGLDYVRYAAEHCPIPWYAIGGIDSTHLADVTAAGATRVAVVRALMEAPDPANATRQLLSHLPFSAD